MQDKQGIRSRLAAARKSVVDKDERSLKVMARLLALESLRLGGPTLWYLDVRAEVRTRPTVREQLNSQAEVLIPYCVRDDLELFRLRQWEDLTPGAFGILEPRKSLRALPERHFPAAELSSVIVPGVGFDTQGGRLGHGRGYYDRLFSTLASETLLIGVAFECQLAERIPMEPHDVPMDFLVTEDRTIRCEGRLGLRARAEDC